MSIRVGSGGGSGGGISSIPSDLRFSGATLPNCVTARDNFFTSNPSRLVSDVQVLLQPTGADVVMQVWDGNVWRDITAVIKGDRGIQGIEGDAGQDGAYITSVAVVGVDIVFTKSDTSVVVLPDAMNTLRGEQGATIEDVVISSGDFVFTNSDGSSFSLVGAVDALKGSAGGLPSPYEYRTNVEGKLQLFKGSVLIMEQDEFGAWIIDSVRTGTGSFHLGNAHSMSSVGQNVGFKNDYSTTTEANKLFFFPPWQAVSIDGQQVVDPTVLEFGSLAQTLPNGTVQSSDVLYDFSIVAANNFAVFSITFVPSESYTGFLRNTIISGITNKEIYNTPLNVSLLAGQEYTMLYKYPFFVRSGDSLTLKLIKSDNNPLLVKSGTDTNIPWRRLSQRNFSDVAITTQSAAQIKSLYESNINTNAFTDTEKTKLANLTDNFKGLFSDSAARDSVVLSPQQGWYVIQSDTGSLWYYGGGVWNDTGATSSGDMLKSVYDPQAKNLDVYNTDSHVDGLVNAVYTLTERNKLTSVQSGATANQEDAFLRNRVNHTGSQAVSTIEGLQGALDNKVDIVVGKGLSTNDYTNADKLKLDGVQEQATANQTDSYLLDRANHTGTQAHTTITGLGNAALSTVQSSLTDTTADRLLKVGAFGVGALGTAPEITNFNAYRPSGFYSVSSDAVDKPDPESWNSYAVTLGSSVADRTAAILMRSGSHVIRAWLTKREAGTLTSAELYHNRNILGTVSQSAGIPTGAIIQRGSNANGEFTRWADGTQICTHRMNTGVGSVSDNGSFLSPAFSWTYPVPFSNIPSFSASIERINAGSGAYPLGVSRITGFGLAGTTLDFLYVFYTAASGSISSAISLTAIGRWYTL
jgi:hypothetical protein